MGSGGSSGSAGQSSGGAASGGRSAVGGTSAVGGSSTVGGSSAVGGGGGAPNDPSGFERVVACAKPVDLEAHLWAEKASNGYSDANYNQFLSALRDRIPGAYVLHRTLVIQEDPIGGRDDVFVVRSDGQVIYANSNSAAVRLCALENPTIIQECIDTASPLKCSPIDDL
ncbi:MAG: hypothetical protein R3B07_31885 [Polyangiaceae bacterium]